jgi:hypothetical protein
MIKKIVKKIPFFVSTLAGYNEELFYVTSNGQEFKFEKEALEAEELTQKLNKIKSLKWIETNSNIVLEEDQLWHKVEKEEDILITINAFFVDYAYTYFNGERTDNLESKVKIGDWITALYCDNGDNKADLYYYSLDYVKQDIDKFLKSFEE